MPEIDLEPGEYRRKRGWGDPDHPGLYWVYLALGLGFIAYIYSVRHEVSADLLLLCGAGAGFMIGIFFTLLTKHIR